MKTTIKRLRTLVREATRAKTIPAYVHAGTELEKIAQEYQQIVEQFEAADRKSEELNARIAALSNNAEPGISNWIDDVLKRVSRPGFLRAEGLRNTVKLLQLTGDRLKTALR